MHKDSTSLSLLAAGRSAIKSNWGVGIALFSIIAGYNIWPYVPEASYLSNSDGMGIALCLWLMGVHAYQNKKSFIKLLYVALAFGNVIDEFFGTPFEIKEIEYWAAALAFVVCIIEWKFKPLHD